MFKKFQSIDIHSFFKIILLLFTSLIAITTSLISINHLFPLVNTSLITSQHLGILGGIGIFSALIVVGYAYLKEIFLIWFIFLTIGALSGPFLEPPADPLHHLEQIQDHCEKKINEIPQVNRGLWHYSIASALICQNQNNNSDARSYIRRIEVAHSVIFTFLLSCIFVMAREVGLKTRWAFFSCLIALLFFGTNRFSYFSYYSFAPSAFSISIYWLWATSFFMKMSLRSFLPGFLSILIVLPILITNHLQEAVFIIFLSIIWASLNILIYVRRNPDFRLINYENNNRILAFFLYPKYLFIWIMVLLFFVLPQFDLFIELTDNLNLKNFYREIPVATISQWQKNSDLVIWINEFHLFGKFWTNRINDTLGFIGLAMVILSFLFIIPGFIKENKEIIIKIIIIGLLPFIYYLNPLFHYLWASNVNSAEYYRLCYSSMFWLFFPFILQNLEAIISLGYDKYRLD